MRRNYVVVNHLHEMTMLATHDPDVDPPWPARRGKLVLLDESKPLPRAGDFIEEFWGPKRKRRVRRFLWKHVSWLGSVVTFVVTYLFMR